MLGSNQPEVSAYTDADWGNDHDDRHSIGAYIIKVGGGVVSWKSKKHMCVTLSSTEAEYVALCQAAKEFVWTIEFLKTLGVSICDMIDQLEGDLNGGPTTRVCYQLFTQSDN